MLVDAAHVVLAAEVDLEQSDQRQDCFVGRSSKKSRQGDPTVVHRICMQHQNGGELSELILEPDRR